MRFAILLALVALQLALLAACGGGGETEQTPTPSPADLIAARDSLPLPPGAAIRARIGPAELQTSYFVPEEQDAIVELYGRELPAQGWQPEDPPPAQWRLENLGSQVTSVSSFVKGDVRVVIMVAPNEKDSAGGATLLDIAVEPRS